MTTTPVRIDPRIRKRRIEVQREAGRRRLRVLLVLMTVLSLAGLAYLTVTSPLLDVDRIEVVGAQHVSADEVRAASGVHLHAPLLFVDSGSVARRVERLPWIAHASVHGVLPGTLRISVVEYAPVAYVRAPTGVLLVAANAHVIARAATPDHGLVEIRGLRALPGVGDLLAAADAPSIVAKLPAALAEQVGSIDVSGGALTLDLRQGGEIRFGNARDADAKSAAALAVLRYLGSAHFRYIDVSTPQRPVSHD
ncbi:MAG TPA: FtsQ-type POTRA domain-containing protein [Acidimicrobiia bacterium]|nr:FtsQ-type POTRA domain-containing protein [Acidimicrobiia bacterium]